MADFIISVILAVAVGVVTILLGSLKKKLLMGLFKEAHAE